MGLLKQEMEINIMIAKCRRAGKLQSGGIQEEHWKFQEKSSVEFLYALHGKTLLCAVSNSLLRQNVSHRTNSTVAFDRSIFEIELILEQSQIQKWFHGVLASTKNIVHIL